MHSEDNINVYDVVVIGSGPTGLVAASACAAAACRVLVLEHEGATGAPTLYPVRNNNTGAIGYGRVRHKAAVRALNVTFSCASSPSPLPSPALPGPLPAGSPSCRSSQTAFPGCLLEHESVWHSYCSRPALLPACSEVQRTT